MDINIGKTMSDYSNFDNDELLALADWNFKKTDYQAAIEKLKTLLARNNVPLNTYALLGRVYATIGLFERAKGAFQFFIDQKQDPSTALNERFQLGLVENDLGNSEQAIKIWDEVLASHSNFVPAMYHKAKVLVELNQVQVAVELLNNLLETAEDGNEYIPMADKLLSKLVLQ